MLSKTLALLGNFAAFIAAFTLVCAGVGALLPEQKVPIVSTKLDWLAEHGDDYDTLFIGSSRTYHQILPEMFDTDMAAAGHPVRSFNAGVDGMRPPEDTYLLEKILAHRTKPVRLVLVECNFIRLQQRGMDRDTLRMVYWHDNVRMGTLLRAVWIGDGNKRMLRRFKKVLEKWPDFPDHIRYWMWQNSNLGRGHDMLAEWTGMAPRNGLLASDLGKRNDGYKPFSGTSLANEEQIVVYEKDIAAMRAKLVRANGGDPVSLAELLVKQRLIEKAGGRMVLVLPPYIGENFFSPKQGEGMPPLLDFSDPEKYPELFSNENRADSAHTNVAGSHIYTHLVVRELLSLLNAEAAKK